uniref:NADH dehydrogenase subunit 4L n=1 Tax=Brueelia antiqua TaxID=580326 RepID=UPI00211E48F2|nr:NADH dehydrogenase subunit 4L [Brueelia antiqua]UTT72553.1 NADH dehydrogenase subunit 4L [Brueelia antiqua]
MEFMGVFFVLVGLMKFLSTTKMMIMVMSLELCSIFLFYLLVVFSSVSGGAFVGLYSVFLVFVVCEGVLVLVSVLGIFRKGSLMVKSLYLLKF